MALPDERPLAKVNLSDIPLSVFHAAPACPFFQIETPTGPEPSSEREFVTWNYEIRRNLEIIA